MHTDTERLAELYEIEAIKRLKARYLRLQDLKQWDEWRELFTEDLHLDLPDQTLDGRDEIVAMVSQLMVEAQTVHQGHMPDIEITGPTTARGVWALHGYVEFPPDSERHGVDSFGYYEDEYRKEGDDWKLSSIKLRYIRMDPLVGPPLPPTPF